MNKNLFIKQLLNNSENGELKRLGKLFSTEKFNYFYDTGTGKIIQLDERSVGIFKKIFTDDLNLNNLLTDDYSEFVQFCIDEKLLQAIKPTSFSNELRRYEDLPRIVNGEMEQLILKVTGRCNFRCKYCIYNDEYDKNEGFLNEDMSREIAKKSIEFYYNNSKNSQYKAITFYGGEPLLKFDLIQNSIDYAIELFAEKSDELSFSFTSNLSLLTPEMANYLASINNFNLVCSLDGDEISQNAYRQYRNGGETFNDVINNLRMLCEIIEEKGNTTFGLAVNMVFTPPYSFEKLDRVNKFFESLDFLPKNFSIMITYPSLGSLDDTVAIAELKDNPKYKKYSFGNSIFTDPLQQWSEQMVIKNGINENSEKTLYGNLIKGQLIRINTRYVFDEVFENYPFNGCCVPGMRRLYVDTKGDFYVCERVGKTPKIGNINDGIDLDVIYQKYIKDYEEESIKHCKDCWAIRLCGICFASNMNEEGIDPNYHIKSCDINRGKLENQLIFYCKLIEEDYDLTFLQNEYLY